MRGSLLSFDSQATAIGIGGALGVIGTACAVRIIDIVGRKWRSVPAVGVAGGIRIIRIGAQLAPVGPLLVIEPWRVRREGILRRLIAERTAVRIEGIVDSVRRKRTPRPVRIGRRVLLVRIRAQFPEVFGGGRKRYEKEQEEKQWHHALEHKDRYGIGVTAPRRAPCKQR